MEDEKPKRKREKTKGLPSDPDALEKWQNLPHNPPSRDALPPATGGGSFFGRWLFPRGLFLLIAALILLSLVATVVSRLG